MKSLSYCGDWSEVAKHSDTVKRMIAVFKRDLGSYRSHLHTMMPIIKTFYGSKRSQEIRSISEIAGVKFEDLFLANLSYELSQFSSYIAGCTSVAWKINGVMHHFRTLDWEMPILKRSSMIFNFGSYKAISFPGYVGVLTGVKKGYSISVNQAPAEGHGMNLFGTPIGFIVRNVLELANDYEAAKTLLLKYKPIFPAFVHLVGPSDCCVVEYKPSPLLVESNKITNHYLSERVGDDDFACDSLRRFEKVSKKPRSLVEAKRIFSRVKNEITVYSCLMKPETGEIL